MESASLARSSAFVLLGLSALAGCAEQPAKNVAAEDSAATTTACVGKCDSVGESSDGAFEFVVVGSGAGGGPLAANLARAGHKVLLLEAGEDTGGRLTYQVPAWHTLSTEDPAMRWDYFVDHYGDKAQAARDSKITPEGVLYPRAGTLGGCTAHNAMITVYPHESDWDKIAAVTGDSSWAGANMRPYFELIEKNKYLKSSGDWSGHGTDGWLQTERANPLLALRDTRLLHIVTAASLGFVDATESGLLDSLTGDFRELMGVMNRDLNSAAPGRDQTEGLFSIPLATKAGHRNGTREYILSTASAGFPLTVRTRALVTNLVYDDVDPTKVIGVEYLPGAHLYQADPAAKKDAAIGEKARVTVTREVILSAGAFNTPQLLKLSGIGPAKELESLGIPVRADLPGVGANLQDRYEVGVVSELDGDLKLLKDCTFDGKPNDKCFVEWQRNGGGAYSSNGGVVGIVKRSSRAEDNPDLFIFGLPGYFKGYYPGYGKNAVSTKRHFTWAVLKGHTKNKAGTVTLKSTDPRVRPAINFKYFQEGSVENGEDWDDLNSVVDGVEFVRTLVKKTDDLMVFGSFKEVFPGAAVKSRAQIETFVRNEAWGHHASCTAKIGADDDPMAVLDGDFKVRGTSGLRVVDASVFPDIPGFFIVVPVYMVSEKATDVILASMGESR